MSDLGARLERITRRFVPPDDWFDRVDRRRRQRQRRRRVGAVVASVLVLAGAAVPLMRWGDDRGDEVAVAPTAWRTIFEYGFHARAADMAWPPRIDDPAVTTKLASGRFNVLVAEPFDRRYWVLAGSNPLDQIRVRIASVDVPGTSSVLDYREVGGAIGSGFRGGMCVSGSAPVDAYVFALDPSDGAYLISRIEDGGVPEVLRRGRMNVPAHDRGAATIEATCQLDAGVAQLTMDAGDGPVTVLDEDPLGPFRGSGIYLESREGPAAAAFEHIAFSIPA